MYYANVLIHSAGHDLVDSTDNKWTPLHYAAKSGQPAIVQKLLEHDADMERKAEGKAHDTPVHVAVQLGHKE